MNFLRSFLVCFFSVAAHCHHGHHHGDGNHGNEDGIMCEGKQAMDVTNKLMEKDTNLFVQLVFGSVHFHVNHFKRMIFLRPTYNKIKKTLGDDVVAKLRGDKKAWSEKKQGELIETLIEKDVELLAALACGTVKYHAKLGRIHRKDKEVDALEKSLGKDFMRRIGNSEWAWKQKLRRKMGKHGGHDDNDRHHGHHNDRHHRDHEDRHHRDHDKERHHRDHDKERHHRDHDKERHHRDHDKERRHGPHDHEDRHRRHHDKDHHHGHGHHGPPPQHGKLSPKLHELIEYLKDDPAMVEKVLGHYKNRPGQAVPDAHASPMPPRKQPVSYPSPMPDMNQQPMTYNMANNRMKTGGHAYGGRMSAMSSRKQPAYMKNGPGQAVPDPHASPMPPRKKPVSYPSPMPDMKQQPSAYMANNRMETGSAKPGRLAYGGPYGAAAA